MNRCAPVLFQEHGNVRQGKIVMADPKNNAYYIQPDDWPEQEFAHGPFALKDIQCVHSWIRISIGERLCVNCNEKEEA